MIILFIYIFIRGVMDGSCVGFILLLTYFSSTGFSNNTQSSFGYRLLNDMVSMTLNQQ